MRSALLPLLALPLLAVACDKKESSAATPSATAAPAPTPAPAPAAAGVVRLPISSANATFLIDAPLEKIKGGTKVSKGQLDLDPADLTKSKGEVWLSLTDLVTTTFGDKGKDESQTEHARNWMEVGPESKADAKAKYQYVKFTITKVETATPKLADVKEEGGARTFKATVTGDLWLHDKSASKSAKVTVTVKGPADAPTEVSFKTDEPFALSLKEHEVMPRDKVGSFLNGALEKIGKKIDDKVQISVDATAKK